MRYDGFRPVVPETGFAFPALQQKAEDTGRPIEELFDEAMTQEFEGLGIEPIHIDHSNLTPKSA